MPHHTINEGFPKAEALFHTHRYNLSPDGLSLFTMSVLLSILLARNMQPGNLVFGCPMFIAGRLEWKSSFPVFGSD